jgi:hypothetical protein
VAEAWKFPDKRELAMALSKACANCGRVFSFQAHRANSAKYCNRRCFSEARAAIAAAEANPAKRLKYKISAGGCWVWLGGKDRLGYGKLVFLGKRWQAHRLSYEVARGKIADGLELDHLCRNHSCINPAHLEPVSHRENMLRSATKVAENARKTHCKYGHPLTPDNLYVGKGSRGRVCATCRRSYQPPAKRAALLHCDTARHIAPVGQ